MTTTPLCLKSFQASNQIYKYILQYNAFAYLSIEARKFQIINSTKDIFCYCLYALCILVMMTCSVDVVYEMCVSKTIKMSIPYLALSLFLVALEMSALVFLIMFFFNRKIFYGHCLNNLLKFESSLCMTSNQKVTQKPILELLKIGKFSYIVLHIT